jgi:transcriptional pleiotropic regulator of transition state genes
MKSTGIIRNVDDLGRIVLPIEIRKTFNLDPKDQVEIYTDNDMIVLKKYHRNCVFCKSTENIEDFKGKAVCANCKKELASLD